MFSSIRTSKENRVLVTKLTYKLNLGPENVVARLAFAYSLARNRVMKLSEIEDAGGKEYGAKVLFGEYQEMYISLVCMQYKIHRLNKDVPRYIKMHLDDGLKLMDQALEGKDTISGTEFLINEIEKGLANVQ